MKKSLGLLGVLAGVGLAMNDSPLFQCLAVSKEACPATCYWCMGGPANIPGACVDTNSKNAYEATSPDYDCQAGLMSGTPPNVGGTPGGDAGNGNAGDAHHPRASGGGTGNDAGPLSALEDLSSFSQLDWLPQGDKDLDVQEALKCASLTGVSMTVTGLEGAAANMLEGMDMDAMMPATPAQCTAKGCASMSVSMTMSLMGITIDMDLQPCIPVSPYLGCNAMKEMTERAYSHMDSDELGFTYGEVTNWQCPEDQTGHAKEIGMTYKIPLRAGHGIVCDNTDDLIKTWKTKMSEIGSWPEELIEIIVEFCATGSSSRKLLETDTLKVIFNANPDGERSAADAIVKLDESITAGSFGDETLDNAVDFTNEEDMVLGYEPESMQVVDEKITQEEEAKKQAMATAQTQHVSVGLLVGIIAVSALALHR